MSLLNVMPGNTKENIHVLYNQIEQGLDIQKRTSLWWLSYSKFGMYASIRCWKIGFYQRRIHVLPKQDVIKLVSSTDMSV